MQPGRAGLICEAVDGQVGEGKISYGLNLDGRIGPNDFTSPEGEKGVDNNMFRAIGNSPAALEGYLGLNGALPCLARVPRPPHATDVHVDRGGGAATGGRADWG